jgi:hypothetical protein
VSRSRFNRQIGKWHAGHARFLKFVLSNAEEKLIETYTRQRRRSIARAFAWNGMSGEEAPFTDSGIIPRKTRRLMALELAKNRLRVLRKEQGPRAHGPDRAEYPGKLRP